MKLRSLISTLALFHRLSPVSSNYEPLFHLSSGAAVFNTPSSGGVIQIKLPSFAATPVTQNVENGTAKNENDVLQDNNIGVEVEVDLTRMNDLTSDSIEIDLGEGKGPMTFVRDHYDVHGDSNFTNNNDGISGTNGRRRGRKLRRIQELLLQQPDPEVAPDIKMDSIADVVDPYSLSYHTDYLPPNSYFPPDDPSQKFQYFEGRGVFQEAEATLYVKSLVHPTIPGVKYLSGIIVTNRYEYVFRGDPVTGRTFLTQMDPATFPEMPPPVKPEEDMDANGDFTSNIQVELNGRRLKLQEEFARQIEEEVEKDQQLERKGSVRRRRAQTDDGSVLDIMVSGL